MPRKLPPTLFPASKRPAGAERRPQRRFKIRRHNRLPPLPPDVWAVIAHHLQARPHALLMCCMASKALQAMIRDDHDLWRRAYVAWEGGWLRKFPTSQHYFRPVPNALNSFHLPRVLAPCAQPHVANFTRATIPLSDRPDFNAFVRKLVAMQYCSRCSTCGTARRVVKPYWSLGLRLCRPCLAANIISSRVLRLKYGLGLGSQVQPSGQRLMDAVQRRVLYFRTWLSATERLKYSLDAMDFSFGAQGAEIIYFFWLPHLRKVVDLEAAYAHKTARDEAASVINCYVRAKHVRVIQRSTRSQTNPYSRLKALFTNERARQSKPIVYADPFWHRLTAADRNLLANGADSLPEPWETTLHPVVPPNNRPAHPLLEN